MNIRLAARSVAFTLADSERAVLPKSAFVFPDAAPGAGSWPVGTSEDPKTKKWAIKALQMASWPQHENVRGSVYDAVAREWPDLKEEVEQLRAKHGVK